MGDGGGQRPRVQRVVGGRYRLIERIGSGGMGTVWRAHDELVSREVAVKQPRLPGDPEDEVHRRAAQRLRREARAAARVDHPSAVAVHDVVEEDGLPWIVMELVRGESLHEVLRRGPLEPAEAARIGLAVLGALRAAHAVGIVHRDVKPANVLLGRHGRVVLTDFGIAHVQGEDSLTASGEFVGSLEFIAPERMSGRGAGPSSDLWSFGVLLYAAVEGWSPFRRTAPAATLAAILTVDLPEPRRAGALGPLLVRLLEKDPALRPDAEETAAALHAVALESAAMGSAARPREPGERAGERPEERQAELPELRWPTLSEQPALQDASALAEFGDDVGTLPLGAAPEPMAVAGPEPAGDPRARRPPHRRTVPFVPLALLGGLLAGAVWLGVSLFTGPDGGAVTDDAKSTTTGRSTASPAPKPSPTGGSPLGGWVPHPEKEMGVTLALPPGYEEFARQGSAAFQPRVVEYAAADGPVQVRLTKWDRSPGTPLSQAKQHAATFEFFGNATTRYTPTRFKGWDAVRSDSTFGDEGLRKRVVELFVRTAGGGLYELRVEMPEGGAEEREGMAVFTGARDRLDVATSAPTTQRS